MSESKLAETFSRYPSFVKCRIVHDRVAKTKAYGFASFLNPFECARAMKELDGKYVGSRPIQLRRSTWSERNTSGNTEPPKQRKLGK